MPTTLAPPPVRPSVVSVDVIVSAPNPAPPARTPLPIRVRRLANLATVAVLFLGLGLPLFGFLFRDPPPLDENRARHPLPPLALKRHVLQDFPQWFSMYFKDRVGYRDVLLSWHRHATFRWLDMPVSSQAWVGKDGWVYLNVADPFVRHPEKGSLNDRVDRWCEAFADRRAYLAARGIEYVVVLVPEKSAVYPDHLTGHSKRHPPPEPLARAERKLRDAGVSCANLLPAFLAAKEKGPEPLYFATDSHWTPAGSRIGYDAVCETLTVKFGNFRPHPESHYLRRDHDHPGDLLRLTGDTDRAPEPCRQFLPPTGAVTVDEAPAFAALLPDAMKPKHLPPLAFANPTAAGPGVVFLRDSFGDALLPFVGTDFPRVAAVGTHHFPTAVIDREKPAMVIQEIAARFLYSTSPANEPAVTGYRQRR